MTVDRMPVLKAGVEEGKLKVTWPEQSWANWQELQSSTEIQQLKETADSRIASSVGANEKGKGAGKGPCHT